MASNQVNQILIDFRHALAAAMTLSDVESIRVSHLGNKSSIRAALASIGRLPTEERKFYASEIQAARTEMETSLEARHKAIQASVTAAQIHREWMDLSVPVTASSSGAEHPVSLMTARCMDIVRRLGFVAVDGPEIETPFHNFDALNIPEHHPARDMQDTFWLQGGEHLLRSHTTTVQVRALETLDIDTLPLKIVSSGRVYRNEAVDATHLAMFHQFEGLWVERSLNLSHLKGVMEFIVKELMGQDRKIRFKPKFYPYTEPSVGVDVSCISCQGQGCEACHGVGWVTVLGAGMVHPNVFREVGLPDDLRGIAFGLGMTRMTAQHVGIKKVRSMYESDLRVHEALRKAWR